MNELRAYDTCDLCRKPGELGAGMRAHAVAVQGYDARVVVVLHVEQCAVEFFHKHGDEPVTVVRKCVYCEEDGRLGPDLRVYSVKTPKGKTVEKILHGSDTGRDCATKWHEKYRKWLAEQQAKVANSG